MTQEQPGAGAPQAVDYFSEIAVKFDGQYHRRSEFADRFAVWQDAIDTHIMGCRTVFDIGCGSGVLSFYAATKGVSVTGVDGAAGMVELCNRHRTEHGVESSRFFTRRLPDRSILELGRADMIICSSVLEYVPEFEQSLELLRDLLSDRGVLLLSLPNRSSFYRRLLKIICALTGKPEYYRYVKNVLTVGDLTRTAARLGMRVTGFRFFNFKIPLSGLLTRILPEKYTANLFLAVLRKDAGT